MTCMRETREGSGGVGMGDLLERVVVGRRAAKKRPWSCLLDSRLVKRIGATSHPRADPEPVFYRRDPPPPRPPINMKLKNKKTSYLLV